MPLLIDWFMMSSRRNSLAATLQLLHARLRSFFCPSNPQLAALPQLIDWLREQTQQSGSPLQAAVDFSKVAAMGHSRGAKLAALLLAGRSLLRLGVACQLASGCAG